MSSVNSVSSWLRAPASSLEMLLRTDSLGGSTRPFSILLGYVKWTPTLSVGQAGSTGLLCIVNAVASGMPYNHLAQSITLIVEIK